MHAWEISQCRPMPSSYVTVRKYTNNNKTKSAVTSFVIGDKVPSIIKTKSLSFFKSVLKLTVHGNRWVGADTFARAGVKGDRRSK